MLHFHEHNINTDTRICSFKCDGALTDIAEQHREEDEPVSSPQQHDGQVHPEVENLEDL